MSKDNDNFDQIDIFDFINSENSDTEIYEIDKDILKKSNFLINMKYSLTLNAQKILDIAMLKLQNNEYTRNPINNALVIQYTAGELVRELGQKSGSIYNALLPIAGSLHGLSVGYIDPKRGFAFRTLVSGCTYNASTNIFNIEFDAMFAPYLTNVVTGFTPLKKQLINSWTSMYASKLYQYLRMMTFYPTGYTGKKTWAFQKDVSVYELRCILGVMNAALDSVRKVLENTNPPDYKKAWEKCPEKKLEAWGDFKKRALLPAINEINTSPLSDINVEMKPRKGARGAIEQVSFYMVLKEKRKEYLEKEQRKNKESVKEMRTEEEIEELLYQKMEFLEIISSNFMEIGRKLGLNELRSIAEAADYDEEKYKRAFHECKAQVKDDKIPNPVGWMIAALKKNYQFEKVEKDNIDRYKSLFNAIEPQEYDFNEIEQTIVNNPNAGIATESNNGQEEFQLEWFTNDENIGI